MRMPPAPASAPIPVHTQVLRSRATLAARQPAGFGYPTNSLAGVIDNPLDLRPLCTALTRLGVAPHRVETLRGSIDRHRFEQAPAAGLLGTVRRWLGALGPEPELLQRYARELAAGHTLVLVHNVRRADAEGLCAVLACNGGHAMQHFGRLTIAMLAP